MIEQELAEMKQRLAKLEAQAARRPSQAWREIIGTSEGDELDREASRLGAEYRAKQNTPRATTRWPGSNEQFLANNANLRKLLTQIATAAATTAETPNTARQ